MNDTTTYYNNMNVEQHNNKDNHKHKHDDPKQQNHNHDAEILEEKIMKLSYYESERSNKRNQLELMFKQYQTMKQQMDDMEGELMNIDQTIDNLENDIDIIRASNGTNNGASTRPTIRPTTINATPMIKKEVTIKTTNTKNPYSKNDQKKAAVVITKEKEENDHNNNNSSTSAASSTRLQQNDTSFKNNNDDGGYYPDEDDYYHDIEEFTQTQHHHHHDIEEFTQTQHPQHHQQHYSVPRVSTDSMSSFNILPLTITTTATPNQNNSMMTTTTNLNVNKNNGTLDSFFSSSNSNSNNNTNRNNINNNNATTTKPKPKETTIIYPWTYQVDELLHNIFKIKSFRDQQREIIDATLLNDDVFVIMRTGGGKSLTYQLPALLEGQYGTEKKITFVISPLLSLIQDQVEQMNSFVANSATSFTSGMAGGITEHANRWNQVRDPNSGICLVYVTPEKVSQSNKFCNELEKLFKQNRLGRFVIDECHCACQWGHDFRPDYAKLGKLKAHFPTIPVLAVTATASDRVRDDVCTILNINQHQSHNHYNNNNSNRNNPKYHFFRTTANRPNLHYSVQCKRNDTGKDQTVIIDMVNFIKHYHSYSAGIVYTYSKKDADVVSSSLCEYGIIARAYHSDISSKQKEIIHRSWMNNQTQVVVATIAFGLGINKPDVRFVLHHSISKTLEAYYQESGRAGRDGLPADCVLYYSPKDFTRLLKMVHGTSSEKLLLPMIRYAQASGNDALCKAIILKHLGEPDCPDVKQVDQDNDGITTIRKEVGIHAKTVVQLLHLRIQQNAKMTTAMLTKEWRTIGANTPNFLKENPPSRDDLSVDDCERLIISLILENVLQTDPVWNAYDTVIYLKLGPFGDRLMKSNDPKIFVKLPIRDNILPNTKTIASKQAGLRKTIVPTGEGWISSKKAVPNKRTTTSVKKVATSQKKTATKKSSTKKSVKFTRSKKTTVTRKKTPTRKTAVPTKKTATSVANITTRNSGVIELSSDDELMRSDDDRSNALSESENEFDG